MPFLRSLARTLRWLPQRLLHPLRRARAERSLRGRPPPRTILFVCHGNICRSPFAQELLLERLPQHLRRTTRVLSAGFIGPNRPSPPAALAAALRAGVDLSGHRSRTLDAQGVRSAELIVVMDELQRRAVCRRFERSESDVLILGDLDPAPIDRRTIRDPVEQPEAVFVDCYGRIERCLSVLTDALARAASDQRVGIGSARGEERAAAGSAG